MAQALIALPTLPEDLAMSTSTRTAAADAHPSSSGGSGALFWTFQALDTLMVHKYIREDKTPIGIK